MTSVKTHTKTTPTQRSDRARYAPLAGAYMVMGIDPKTGEIREAVRLELRGGRKSMRLYSYLRAVTETGGTYGSGLTSGGGYHKPSDAAADAVNDAGYQMTKAFGGHGEGAMIAALEAIAKYHGFVNLTTIHVTD